MTSKMILTRKELDELKPKIDGSIYSVLGAPNEAIAAALIYCLSNGFDAKKTAERLTTVLKPEMASHVVDRVFLAVGRTKPTLTSRHPDKRHHEDRELNGHGKKLKTESDIRKSTNHTPPGDLNDAQIKDMMQNAQRLIQERKKSLNLLRAQEAPTLAATPTPTPAPPPPKENNMDEKQKKLQLLQDQIQAKFSSGILKTIAPPRSMGAIKVAPLILDSEGRTVDITGKEVQLTVVEPTLKANIRARKKEEFKHQVEKPVEEPAENPYFDPRIGQKSVVRQKRALKFNEPGKFQKMADQIRIKAQLTKLQNEISQIAKKTGISSATKLAQIAPDEAATSEDIPEVEWWDSVVLEGEAYEEIEEGQATGIKESAITHLVEHPIQLRPPTEPMAPVYMPVFLTKQERKKLRRQNRREAWKEEQEKIRLGLDAPPEPKLRISNLMRVLGTEAVQDPTKMEAHVRAQMAKRQKAHEDANLSRKLTEEQAREKTIRKLKEDTTLGVHVAVYRIADLSSASKKFKIETNAKQLFMTGAVIIYTNCNVVIVEGGPKQQNKYKRLMLHRIKWEEDMIKDKDGRELPNKCVLVWEGTTKQRNFGEMKFKVCATEKLAREQLKKNGVEHYWDLAYSKVILGESDETL